MPIENGKNRYGLDVSYFRNAINRELNKPLKNHKPDELARVLARLSRTADKSVMFEPEFSNKFAIEQQIEGVAFFALCLRETGQFGLNDCNFIYEYAQECKEQLRKEQKL